MHDCLVAFGSNQGDSLAILEQTLAGLEKMDHIQVIDQSRALKTTPVGGPNHQNLYVNAVIRLVTSLSPEELHQRLVQLESDFGRIRRERWGSRRIDLDLLLYDQMQQSSEKLTIPHPRMSFRRFVLEPAAEIASEMVHIPSRLTIGELVTHLNTRDDLVLLVGAGALMDESNLARDEQRSERVLPALASGWDIRPVDQIDDFRKLESRAKLVCIVNPESIESSQRNPLFARNPMLASSNLSAIATSFCGPTLQLPDNKLQLKTEIVAAIDAMMPLRTDNG